MNVIPILDNEPNITHSSSPKKLQIDIDYLDKLNGTTKEFLKDQRAAYHREYGTLTNLPQHTYTKEAPIPKDIRNKIDELRRDFFAKNLDSSAFMPESIQGAPVAASNFILLNELRQYSQSPGLTFKDKEEVRKAIACLTDLQKLQIDLSCIHDLYDQNSTTHSKQADEILKQLSQFVTDKMTHLQIGEKLVLPGGSLDHAMIYEFIRTGGDDQKPIFSMKIYNSGAGIEHHTSKGLLGIFNPWAKYRTYIVDNISLDQITKPQVGQKENLIHGLFAIKVGAAPANKSNIFHLLHDATICSIYRLVKVTLLNTGAKINKSGQAHYEQVQGSCSRKSKNYLLKESLLSPSNYLRFKVFATETSITRLQHISNMKGEVKKTNKFAQYFFHRSLFARIIFFLRNDISNEAMLDLGQEVLKRRQKKAAKAAKAA